MRREAASRRYEVSAVSGSGAAEEEEIYNLEASSETIPSEWEGGAVYTLEFPARCPHCRELVRSLRVLRLKRSQVSFTSPLPRGGRAIVCSACQGIISADVSTL